MASTSIPTRLPRVTSLGSLPCITDVNRPNILARLTRVTRLPILTRLGRLGRLPVTLARIGRLLSLGRLD